MTDWQPYDTVPRDGSWLRLKGPHTKPEGERVRWERAPDVKPGGGLWINDKGWMAIYEFTHWRPDS